MTTERAPINWNDRADAALRKAARAGLNAEGIAARLSQAFGCRVTESAVRGRAKRIHVTISRDRAAEAVNRSAAARAHWAERRTGAENG